LITAVGLKLMSALKSNPMGMPVCIGLALASFAGVGLLRLPLAWVLLASGSVGCIWAYVQLARQAVNAVGKEQA
jgi:chromate transporter